MRQKLPPSVELQFPLDIVRHIYSYVPKQQRQKRTSVSPQIEKDLKYIQSMRLRGKSTMYLKDLEDFVLD